MILPLRGHLDTPRDIFDCHNLGESVNSIQWTEAKDAAKYLTVHRAPLQRIIQPQVSIVLRLRTLALDSRRSEGQGTGKKFRNGMKETCVQFHILY